MSNITTLRIEIQNPQIDILKEAVKLMAQHFNLETTDTVSDFYGRKVEGVIGLKGRILPRGIGFAIVNNQLMAVGDPYGYRETYNILAESIKQYYIAAQQMIALKMLGYQPTIQRQKEKLVITAVSL